MPATLAQPQAIAPFAGESQADFLERVWDQLPGDSDLDKSRYARDAWFSAGRDGQLQRLAQQTFPADRYRKITGSAVFKEHSTKRTVTDADGMRHEQPVVYDRAALESIRDRCNQRILGTGDFSPLTAGHTPDKEMLAKGAQQPEVLGYAGPFYLGKLNGQYAILCDEHHDRQDLGRIDKLRRRSPEVWMEERMDDRFFDPIACLGAETPRLDLGMTRYGRFFAAHRDGAELMKYAAPAAMPSGSNTFVPGGDDHHHRYEGEASMSPEDVQAVVAAISETDWSQAMQQLAPHVPQLLELIQTEGGEHTPPAHAAPPAAPPSAPPAATTPKPAKPPYEPDEADKHAMSRYMSGDMGDDEFHEHLCSQRNKYNAATDEAEGEEKAEATGDDVADYSAASEKMGAILGKVERSGGRVGETKDGSHFYDGSAMEGKWDSRKGTVKHSRTAQEELAGTSRNVEVARYQRETEQLRQRVEQLEADKRYATRYARLQAKQAEGFLFDLEEEAKDTFDLSDTQFDKHLKRIEKYERSPVGFEMLPTPELDRQRKGKADEEYKRQRKEEIVSIATRKGISFEDAIAEWDAAHPAA